METTDAMSALTGHETIRKFWFDLQFKVKSQVLAFESQVTMEKTQVTKPRQVKA